RMAVALGGSDCEQIRSGWLAQPANAVSSLAYGAVGAWLLRRPPAPAGRRPALLAGGGALIGVGVGSFAYHGPQPGWAPLAHDGSVLGLAAVMIADNVGLLARGGVRRAAGYGVPSAVTALVLAATGRAALVGPALLVAVVAGAALALRPAAPAAPPPPAVTAALGTAPSAKTRAPAPGRLRRPTTVARRAELGITGHYARTDETHHRTRGRPRTGVHGGRRRFPAAGRGAGG